MLPPQPSIQFAPKRTLSQPPIKGLITAGVVILMLAPTLFARDESVLARVTVYWAKGGSGSDRDTRAHRCSTGLRLRAGHCAVDPRKIPYGSRVVLPTGETLAAVDTGSAVKNRKAARQSGRTSYERSALVIDRFFETKRQALAWANTHPPFMPIRVVRPLRAAAQPQLASRATAQPQLASRVTAQSQLASRSQPLITWGPKVVVASSTNTSKSSTTTKSLVATATAPAPVKSRLSTIGR
jgi:hypothetical protein